MEPALCDFATPEAERWRPMDDVIMGGVSRSQFRISAEGTGVFEGFVSLSNNGGFASVRAALDPRDLSAYSGLDIRVRGDGRRYRLRLFTDPGFDAVAYQTGFDSTPDTWTEIFLPFESFAASYRGRCPPDAPPLDAGKIAQAGIMIADRQSGAFRLEIAWIRPGDPGPSAKLGRSLT